MKILVTGGAGFIGSHLVEALLRQNAAVSVIDDLSTGRREYLPTVVRLYEVGVESAEVIHIIEQEKPDYLFHLAAKTNVKQSLEKPVEDARVNVMGTLHVLEGARQAKVRKVIFASTAAVYGDQSTPLVAEDSPTVPISPYGISKLAAEGYVRSYAEQYGFGYAILRYSNVYGPRQDAGSESGVVPIFIGMLLNGETPVVYGDGEQTRDFIYVDDVVAANLAALTATASGTFNISTAGRTSVNELLAQVAALTGSSVRPLVKPARAGDIRQSCLANQTAQDALNWEPTRDLPTGLKETIQAYGELSNGYREVAASN